MSAVGSSTSAPPPQPASAILSLDADENPNAIDNAVPQMITLISKEGRRLPVSRQALMASELCKTTLEGDRDAAEIPLYHIEGVIVQKVIDYLTYHLKVRARTHGHAHARVGRARRRSGLSHDSLLTPPFDHHSPPMMLLPARQIPPRKIEKPLVSNDMKDLVDKWDVTFIESGEPAVASPVTGAPAAPSAAAQETLFKLLLAANYLNIKSLLQLAGAKVASLMKDQSPDQVRSVFNIRADYTQAEEEEVRKEYKDLIG